VCYNSFRTGFADEVIHVDGAIEVHRGPEGNRYTEMFTIYQGGEIAAKAFPEFKFKVDDLIG
jgi:hypothetical protein